MLGYEIIRKKRDGLGLTSQEIKAFVDGVCSSDISPAQVGAFLMASCIRGLNPAEVSELTLAMRDSGKIFDFSYLGLPVVDKHSTGGIGDKISLLMLPILMDFDIVVPMISGRGLGHTGGTIDKLESVIGFKTSLSNDEMHKQIRDLKAFIVAQTADIAPADKILYSIRDITATVESVGLITASILSKKMAEGLNALIIDMKVGNGAFMQTYDAAKELADSMENVAKHADIKFKVCYSNMDKPLGRFAGNWLEMLETEQALSGSAPKDLMDNTKHLCNELLVLAGICNDIYAADRLVSDTISSGRALKNFYKFIEYQGGDWNASKAKYLDIPTHSVLAPCSGVIKQMDTLRIGLANVELGAGRKNQNDIIDFSAGMEFFKKTSEKVSEGEEIVRLYGSNPDLFSKIEPKVLSAYLIE